MAKLPSAIQDILGRLSPQQQRLFACDCAEHVLPYFERFQPLDKRPRTAIEIARQYALGKASQEELDTARADAEGAAWDAGFAAYSAAESAGNTHPQPEDESAAPAAATAEGCSLANLEIAVEAAANTAIAVVVTAAVGVEAAGTVWWGDETLLAAPVLQRYRDAEARERTWQLAQVRRYIALNSEDQ